MHGNDVHETLYIVELMAPVAWLIVKYILYLRNFFSASTVVVDNLNA